MKGTYTSDSGVFQLHQDGHCPSGPFTPFPLPVDKLSQGVGTMEEKTLREQLCAVDGSLLFLGLLLLSVGLSYWGVSIQREELCRTLRGDGAGAEELPEVFPIRLWASALVVGCLGFFLCLAVKTDREAGYETAQSARTNLWASVLVFLAALLRLDELLQSASVGPHSSVQARLE